MRVHANDKTIICIYIFRLAAAAGWRFCWDVQWMAVLS